MAQRATAPERPPESPQRAAPRLVPPDVPRLAPNVRLSGKLEDNSARSILTAMRSENRRGKIVFAAYILIVVPLLAFLLFTMVRSFPRVAATAADSMSKQAVGAPPLSGDLPRPSPSPAASVLGVFTSTRSSMRGHAERKDHDHDGR